MFRHFVTSMFVYNVLISSLPITLFSMFMFLIVWIRSSEFLICVGLMMPKYRDGTFAIALISWDTFDAGHNGFDDYIRFIYFA